MQIFPDAFFVSELSWFIKAFILNFRRKILLFYIMTRVIMSIFVADSFSKLFVTTIMCILQVYRNRCFCIFDGSHGIKDCVYCRVAFWCTGHIGNCLRKDDL